MYKKSVRMWKQNHEQVGDHFVSSIFFISVNKDGLVKERSIPLMIRSQGGIQHTSSVFLLMPS